MPALKFDNAFVRALPGDPERKSLEPRSVSGAVYSLVQPQAMPAPKLLAWSPELARRIGFTQKQVQSEAFAQVFSGNLQLDGMQPFATNYGGHQFGHWAGQLGDGRAISLGELIDADGCRLELQLKGAGRTPYSRGADGRAVLRSSIREFLCSEAMHHLGIPTTRALSLVATGESVLRDMFYDGHPAPEPGAIVCRTAPSFIRFGHFELPASRGDTRLLEQLVEFTIERDFSELPGSGAARRAEWFSEVCARTARMVAEWMRVGFVHGVMNTDNMSILGLTIDYGPYGWIDDFDPDWTPNTTDAQGRRYRFGHQPRVAYWNLTRLAGALVSVMDNDQALHAGLQRYLDVYAACDRRIVAAKLGLSECADEDIERMQDLHQIMRDAQMDMSITYQALSEIDPSHPSVEPLQPAFYDTSLAQRHGDALRTWLSGYVGRLLRDPLDAQARRTRMHAANPRFVLRNYLAQQSIDRATQGDYAGISELLDVMRRPYDEQPGREAFAARRPEWARHRAGSSMLSCSS
ncbi:YdiU family protein [Oleiagrimonas sp.]|uniref:protein adenylyltransferase SelO n=1 Tax=Oleiagrimonas sp. TaxID=2010330 RepID=UPI002606C5DB|nr:YdiU family protein [Oleiagrimonas sp.]MDA3913594.1 YdiU family protein [Oleiagrimonas sp.]